MLCHWFNKRCFVSDKGALTCNPDDFTWQISSVPEARELPFFCEFDQPCLAPNLCQNSGRCVPTPQLDDYVCDCSKTNYTGKHCDLEFVVDPALMPRFAAQDSLLENPAERNYNTSELDSIQDGITPDSLVTIVWICSCVFLAIITSIGGGYIICFKRKKAGAEAAAGGGLDSSGSAFGIGSQADLSQLGSTADLAGAGAGSQADLGQGSFAAF